MCNSTGPINAEMLIPEIMEIYWRTEDQTSNSIVVPVKNRLTQTSLFFTIVVKFDSEKVYVMQRVMHRVGDVRETQIYP